MNLFSSTSLQNTSTGTSIPGTSRAMGGYDPVLLAVTALLCLLGLVMIYTASTSLSDRIHGSSFYFLRNHLLHLAIGMIALVVAMRIPFEAWKTFVPVLLAVCLALLILVLIPGVGHKVGGAQRWLRVGPLSFQPTELLKLVMIFNVAYFLDRKGEMVQEFRRGLAPNMVVLAIFLSLVMLQPDFGSSVLIALTVMLMIFVGGAKPGHILFGLAGFGMIGVWLIFSQSYRMKRMLAFLDPWQDRLDTGFQIIQSYLAFGSGGWLGVGLGDSRQKMFFLPEAHTDFIVSILAEELGVIGVVSLVGLMACFLWRGFAICLNSQDDFGRYLAFGISALLGLQMVLNLAVVMGMMPTKGLPLPFISYGGSALMINLFMTGILLNVGRQRGAFKPRVEVRTS